MVLETRVSPLFHLQLQCQPDIEMKRTKSRGSSSSSGKAGKAEPAAKKRGTVGTAADRTALKWVDEDIQSSDSEDESRNVPGNDDAEESDEDGDESAEQRRKRFQRICQTHLQNSHIVSTVIIHPSLTVFT